MPSLTVLELSGLQTKNLKTGETYAKTSRVLSVSSAGFGSLRTLRRVLKSLQRQRSCCVIRGTLRDDAPSGGIRRRKTYFADTPQPWVMLDIDKLKLPRELRQTPYDSRHAEYARSQLPPEFQGVGCVWQASASAGVARRKLKMHLWFLLDSPVTAAQLRAWLAGCSTIDPVTLRSVQPHYTAAPIGSKRGYKGKRLGVLEGDKKFVTVPSDLGDGKISYEQRAIEPRGADTFDISERDIASVKKSALAEAEAELNRSAVKSGYDIALRIGAILGRSVAADTWNDREHGHEAWKSLGESSAADWGNRVACLPGAQHSAETYAGRVWQGLAFAVGEQRNRYAARMVRETEAVRAALAAAHVARGSEAGLNTLAKRLAKYRTNPKVVTQLAEATGFSEQQAADALASSEDWETKLDVKGKSGEPVSSFANLAHVFRHHPDFLRQFRFNVRASRRVLLADNVLGLPSGEIDSSKLQSRVAEWLSSLGFKGFSQHMMIGALDVALADCEQFDPFIELLPELQLSAVEAADELKRLGRGKLRYWLQDYFGASNTKYTRAVAMRSLMSCVARAVRPGCQVDTMLVLAGPQGIGKTTAVRALANVIDSGYSELIDIHERESAMKTQRSLIVEVNELRAIRGRNEEAAKAYITRGVDQYRAPYAKDVQEHPRRNIFIGTTNDNEFLHDYENRRFWPVVCTKRGTLTPEAAMVLWREAALRYVVRPKWWLSGALEDEQKRVAARHRDGNEVLESSLSAWLEDRERVTMADVMGVVAPERRLDRSAQLAAGRELRVLGWHKVNGRDGKYWVRRR